MTPQNDDAKTFLIWQTDAPSSTFWRLQLLSLNTVHHT